MLLDSEISSGGKGSEMARDGQPYACFVMKRIDDYYRSEDVV